MGTGILYAVIVLAWAAYLIPIVRSHRQESAAVRSADRFADAMRVLGKRSSSSRARGSSRVTAPPPRTRPQSLVLVDSGAGHDEPAEPEARSRPRVSAARRRRRVLAGIVGLAVVLAVLAYVGMVRWVSLAVPVVLFVGFVLLARVSLRRRSVARRRSVVTTRRSAARQASVQPRRMRRPVRRVESGAPAAAAQAGRMRGEAGSDLGVTVIPAAARGSASGSGAAEVAPRVPAASAASVGAVDATAREAADAASAWLAHADLDRWDPVPVTLPTYVDKATAQPRSVRKVDLSGPDAFSAGRLPEAAMLTRQPDSVEALAGGAGAEPRASSECRGDDGEMRAAAGA